jgi:hypothetical protein
MRVRSLRPLSRMYGRAFSPPPPLAAAELARLLEEHGAGPRRPAEPASAEASGPEGKPVPR